MISAGFDGHRDDPLGGDLGLSEDDYRWLTSEITKVCDDPSSACKGRICSVLEGGYDISDTTNALAKSVVAHVETLSKVPEKHSQKTTTTATTETTTETTTDTTTETTVSTR